MSYVFQVCFCFFKQKTAYEMRISDWSSDVCSSDLLVEHDGVVHRAAEAQVALAHELQVAHEAEGAGAADLADVGLAGEFHHRARLRARDRGMVAIGRASCRARVCQYV